MTPSPAPLPPPETGLGAITASEILMLAVGGFFTLAVATFLIVMLVRNQVRDR